MNLRDYQIDTIDRVQKSRRKNVVHICRRCGAEFNPYRGAPGIYCSRKCSRNGRIVTPLAERFWKYVTKTDGCWLWTGCKNEHGYGVIGRGTRHHKMAKAHRVSWEIHRGPIESSKLFVCHKCDTPACVNPDHLFLGTGRENMADARAKGRIRFVPSGFAVKLTDKAVAFIRSAHERGFSQREIAEAFGVGRNTVCRIVNHQRRRDVA